MKYHKSTCSPRVPGIRLCLFVLLSCLLAPFSSAADGWNLTKASLDPSKPGPDGEPSIKVEPGGKAVLKLRDTDGTGTVRMAVWDDGTKAMSDPSKSATGPRWGVGQSDGRMLAGGIMYARYLAEGGSLCIIDADRADPVSWFKLNYFGGRNKSAKWSTWEFNFDANDGITLKVDGRAVPQKRYDWNKGEITGFREVVILGDETGSPNAQTFWVADVESTLAGPMQVKPAGAPPPPKVLPDEDPSPVGPPIMLKEELRGVHPRVLITKDQLPKLRKFYNSDEGKIWREKIEGYRGASRPPDHTKFLTDATDGQRQGFWRMPTVALHYLMTGEKSSLRDAKGFLEHLAKLPAWETTKERNSGMSAANIMIGAGLVYDWIYNDLDPEFRESFREKLLYHSRYMYHGGHLLKNPGPHYWQNDPANNHRWHRNAGLTLSMLAIYENRPEEQWIMQRAIDDLEFVNKWLPHDGSCHEGPGYMVFGGNHLMVAMDAADKAIGTNFLEADYYKNVPLYRMHTLLPGMNGILPYGDTTEGGVATYNNFLLRCVARHNLPDIRDGLLDMVETDPRSMMFGWFSLIWDDPDVPRGDFTNLHTKALFEDVGVATFRDSWSGDAVAGYFKCGPFGGYDMLRYSGGEKYINVAHDDPDANSFILAIGGDIVAKTDGYSKRKSSRNHNTILINDFGQMTKGRPEGGVWSQPGGDMTKMGFLTTYNDTGKVVGVEGEASGSYLAYRDRKTGKSRPGIDRFRRSFLWVEGDYILVLDDIRSPEAVDVSWLMQGEDLKVVDESAGKFKLIAGEASADFMVVSDKPMDFATRVSPADHRGKSLDYQQLVGSITTEDLRVVSIYDPWNHGDLEVTMTDLGNGSASITVTGGTNKDVWTWTMAPDNDTASSISGNRVNGAGTGPLYKQGPADTDLAWKLVQR